MPSRPGGYRETVALTARVSVVGLPFVASTISSTALDAPALAFTGIEITVVLPAATLNTIAP